jgi:hypothetical protein
MIGLFQFCKSSVVLDSRTMDSFATHNIIRFAGNLIPAHTKRAMRFHNIISDKDFPMVLCRSPDTLVNLTTSYVKSVLTRAISILSSNIRDDSGGLVLNRRECCYLLNLRNSIASAVYEVNSNVKCCKRCKLPVRYCKCAMSINRGYSHLCPRRWINETRFDYSVSTVAQNSKIKTARSNVLAVDSIVAFLWLRSSPSVANRSLLNRLSRIIALHLPDMKSEKIVYFAFKPYSNQTYVGCASQGVDTRWSGHWTMAPYGTVPFYQQKDSFFQFLWLPLDNKSVTRMQLLSCETNYMFALRPSLNAYKNASPSYDVPVHHCGRSKTKVDNSYKKTFKKKVARAAEESFANRCIIHHLQLSSRIHQGEFGTYDRVIAAFSRSAHPPAWTVNMILFGSLNRFKLFRRAAQVLSARDYYIFKQNAIAYNIKNEKTFNFVTPFPDNQPGYRQVVDVVSNLCKCLKVDLHIKFSCRRSDKIIDVLRRNNGKKCICAEKIKAFPWLKNWMVGGHVVFDLQKAELCMFANEPYATEKFNTNCRVLRGKKDFRANINNQIRRLIKHVIKKNVSRGGTGVNPAISSSWSTLLSSIFNEVYDQSNYPKVDDLNSKLLDICNGFEVSAIDKAPGCAAVACPLLSQMVLANFLWDPKSAYVRVPGWFGLEDDNTNQFWNLDAVANDDRLTSVNRLKKHRTGFLSILYKSKWFKSDYTRETKEIGDILFRPITSCRKHVYGPLYRIGGRALNFLINLMLPPHQYSSISQFVQKTNDLNLKSSELTNVNVREFYGDLKNFYTSTDTQRGTTCARALVQAASSKGYKYYAVRRSANFYVPKHQAGAGVKYKMNEKLKPREFISKSKPNPRLYDYISLKAVIIVLIHSIKYAYCRAILMVWRQVLGCPMGNHCSSALACLFASSYDAPYEMSRNDSGRTFYGRYHDDKHCFAYHRNSRPPPDPPPGMQRDFYTKDCPMVLTNDGKFCGLLVNSYKNFLAVQPDVRKSCITNAHSCMSKKIVRAITYGCYARLSDTRNKIGDLVYGRINVILSTQKLVDLNFPLKTCLAAIRQFLPHHYVSTAKHFFEKEK